MITIGKYAGSLSKLITVCLFLVGFTKSANPSAADEKGKVESIINKVIDGAGGKGG